MSISVVRRFGGYIVHFLSSVVLVVYCSLDLFVTSAAAIDVGQCGKATGDAAVAACSAVGNANSKNAAAFYVSGNEYQVKGELDRAISDYNEALRLDPKLASAFNSLGRCCLAKNEDDRAIADFNKAVYLWLGIST